MCVFPSELKLAMVVPIFKAGDSNTLTNYRPISVVTFFAKVFRKTVSNKLSNFFSANPLFHSMGNSFFKKNKFYKVGLNYDGNASKPRISKMHNVEETHKKFQKQTDN